MAGPCSGTEKRFSCECVARSRRPTLGLRSVATLTEAALARADGLDRGSGLVGVAKQLHRDWTHWKWQCRNRFGRTCRSVVDVVGIATTPIFANSNGSRRPFAFGIRCSVGAEVVSPRTVGFLFGNLGHVCVGRSVVLAANRTDPGRTLVDSIFLFRHIDVPCQIVHGLGAEAKQVLQSREAVKRRTLVLAILRMASPNRSRPGVSWSPVLGEICALGRDS